MIAFLLKYLDDLEIFACGIGNEYLNTKCRDKLWKSAGTEFGNEKRMATKIARSLYRINRSVATWRKNLSKTLKSLRYK